MRTELATLVDRSAQTSDTATYRKDLGENGCLSALDIGVRLTNGSTSAVNKDLLDVIKHLSLVFNGNDYRWHISGPAAFRHHWLKFGSPMRYSWDQSGSAVQEVWFRMMFGRYIGDPIYGLDLGRHNNVQLQLDYDATVWGAAAATTFTTATFAPTVLAHQFPYNKRPSFRGMLGTSEFYTTTSAASGDILEALPSQNPLLALGVAVMEDNIAEGTDVTDIKVGKDNLSQVWLDGKWYNFQSYQNSLLTERSEVYKLYATTADSLDAHLANVRLMNAKGVPTGWVTSSADGVENFVNGSAVTGNRITITGTTVTLDKSTATTQTASGLSAKAAWIEVQGDVHGYLYFPFADPATFDDAIQPSDLKSAQIKLVQGGAGADVRLIAEQLYNY